MAASSHSGARARAEGRADLRDQGIEAGGNPGRVDVGRRLKRAMRKLGDPFQGLFEPQGSIGRIFILSQSPLRPLRSVLRFNQPTG